MSNTRPGGQPPHDWQPAESPSYGQPGWGSGQAAWPPMANPGSGAPKRRSRAPLFLAAGLVAVLAAGATLWLTVFKDNDAAAGAAPGSQQDVAHRYIEASRAHDLEAIKKISCHADLDKIAKDPADAVIPATVTVVTYKITGQHDVDGGAGATNGATIVDGSITLKDGNNTVTNPIDLVVIKEGGAFKACTSLAIRSDAR